MGIRLTTSAQRDIYRIAAEGLERFGEHQVAKYQTGLNNALVFLSDYPYAAAEHREYKPPVRIYPYEAHVIIFEVSDGDVVVLAICHAREDWTRLV